MGGYGRASPSVINPNQTSWWGDGDVQPRWNPTKQRMEIWIRLQSGNYMLYDAFPARKYQDRFSLGPNLAPAFLGLSSELPWSINGRMNGAVAPDNTCFLPANEVGGGMNQIVKAAGQVGDYTAIHWGGNYPIRVQDSPKVGIIADFEDDVTVGYLLGLVCDSRPDGTAAYALPVNGIFFILDTNIYADAHLRLVVRVAGVNVYEEDVGAVPAGHSLGCICVSDDGTEVEFGLNGYLAGHWAGALPACRMQPYAAIVAYNVMLNPVTLFMGDFHMLLDSIIGGY